MLCTSCSNVLGAISLLAQLNKNQRILDARLTLDVNGDSDCITFNSYVFDAEGWNIVYVEWAPSLILR